MTATPVPQEVAWTRRVPVRYEADVAVLGGGIAGACAACAAAASGASVVLVERFAVTGGVMTSGGVGNFCGDMTGQGEVFDEIIAALLAFHATEPGETIFDHEILAVVLQELLLRRGVKLLLHTRFVDVRLRGRRIAECLLCGASGLEALRAAQFIDTTGEGQVAHAAGFSTMKGRPEDGLQLPMSVMFFVREMTDPVVPQLPDGWFEPVSKADDLPMTSLWPNGPCEKAIKVKIPMFDSADTENMTAAEIRARRRMFEVLDFYQRIEKRPWRFDHCSPIIGIREGRRIAGDYVLTVEDLRAGRTFDDAVARGSYVLDAHAPDDDKRTMVLTKEQMEVPPYQIPYRSFVARDGENLMMAGRCFSADQLALSSARVATTCAMMGQATGIAAALAARRGCDPRALDVQEVRRTVEERGAALSV